MPPCRQNADPRPVFRLVVEVFKTTTRSAPAGNDDDHPASAPPRARLGGNRSWSADPQPYSRKNGPASRLSQCRRGSQNPNEEGATRRRRWSPQHVLPDAPAHKRVLIPTLVTRKPAAWPPRPGRRRPACAGARTHKRRSDLQRQLPAPIGPAAPAARHPRPCVRGRTVATDDGEPPPLPNRDWTARPPRLPPPGQLRPRGPVRGRDRPIGFHYPRILPRRFESRVGGM